MKTYHVPGTNISLLTATQSSTVWVGHTSQDHMPARKMSHLLLWCKRQIHVSKRETGPAGKIRLVEKMRALRRWIPMEQTRLDRTNVPSNQALESFSCTRGRRLLLKGLLHHVVERDRTTTRHTLLDTDSRIQNTQNSCHYYKSSPPAQTPQSARVQTLEKTHQ